MSTRYGVLLSVAGASPRTAEEQEEEEEEEDCQLQYAFAAARPQSTLDVQETPLLHHFLLQLLRTPDTDAGEPQAAWVAITTAVRLIVEACAGVGRNSVTPGGQALWPHTEAALERLLHVTLDSAASSKRDPSKRRRLAAVLGILQRIEHCYEGVVGRAARHSDVGHWPLLFAPDFAGPPSALFERCLQKASAETSAMAARAAAANASRGHASRYL
eukprot:COSAG05_NODE_5774_length_1091_cov_0.827621_1_plen_215_part_01